MPPENKIDCPALHKRSSGYPFGDRVPRTVRMLKTVTADPMPGIGLAYIKGNAPAAKSGQTYPVWTNSHGAVTAVMEDGTRLGLRPEEFEVESWHHLAAAPIPQPHPDPIAWMVGTAIWWTKEEAERDAAATGLPIVGLGPMTDTSELEQLVDANTEYARRHLEQLDEAERLRAENEKLREGISKHWKVVCDQRAEIDILRAKLAKWDLLLREIADHCNGCVMPTEQLLRDWGLSIDAALYASAEPSAPVVAIPDGYCVMPRRLTAENGAKALLLGEFKLEVTQECPECRELDEPVEGCEICDGEGEYGQRHIIPWDKIKYIYREAVKGLAIQPNTTREPS